MNKKYIAIILSLVLIFSAVMLISGCNKDDESTILPNESTDVVPETEQNSEESSIDETESTTDEKETEKNTETEKESESTSKPDENKTESSTNPVEKPTDNDEPVTCDVCGNLVVKDTGKGDISVGNYCDGKCDEWFGELELE